MSNITEQSKQLEDKLLTIGKSASVFLPAEEKRAMRNAILAAMREMPVREQAPSRLLTQSARKEKRSNIILTIKNMIAGIIIAALLGGGVSFAAEGALPGDLLYPVKTSINEEVRSTLAISAESKAELHAKFAERRLEEAERLASSGRLSIETGAQIAANFKSHAQESESQSEKAEAKGGAEAAVGIHSNFESALLAHEKVLAKIEVKNPESKEHLEVVLRDVRAEISTVTKKRESGEQKVSAQSSAGVKVSAEGAMKSAENKIDEVKKFLENKKADMSAGVYAGVEARIAAAEAIFAEGKAKFDAGAYGEAFTLFKKSQREVQSAKLLANAAAEFEIEINGVHATGTLDSDHKITLPNGKVQIINGKVEVETQDGDGRSSSSIKINVNTSGTSGASVYTRQKIQVNSAGYGGIRTDFMDVAFEDYLIKEIKEKGLTKNSM